MYKRLTREEKYTYMSERDVTLTNCEILDILAKDGGRVHFIGVGGVSMCSIFCLCRHFGIRASGSDRKENLLTKALIDAGEDIYIGEKKALPEGTSLVVYSHAVKQSHPERVYARANGIIEVDRAQYLGALMQCYVFKIGVSGSHGKSTVTAMISKIFTDSNLSPTTLSGASLFNSKLPFAIGSLDFLVYEGCEYKDSFLSFHPSIGVFLNLELDHTDYFKDIEAISDSFLRAMKNCERLVVNADDERLFDLAKRSCVPIVTYGTGPFCDYRYEIIEKGTHTLKLKLYERGRELGEVSLPMLGSFNAANATAAIAVALESFIDFTKARDSLSAFTGIERRLEYIGEYKGRKIYYDYAHHPTEIKASIAAIKDTGSGVTVIFRPHTYSRTEGLWSEFVSALRGADFVLLLEIDGVREEKGEKVSSRDLAKCVGGVFCEGGEEVIESLDSTEGDIILMGAADVLEIKNYLTNAPR